MKIKSKNKVKKIQQKLFDINIITSAIYKCKIVYTSKRLKRKFLRENNCHGSNDAMTTSEFTL